MTGNIVCFSSWGPGNFATVLAFCDKNPEWRVRQLVSDRPGTPSTRLAAGRSILVAVHDIPGIFDPNDPGSRARREAALLPVVQTLDRFETCEGPIDLIVLAFRKVLSGEILTRYGERMINVHPADLSVFDPMSRKPRYVGIGGLARSIRDGNLTTRTSVHRVTSGVDEGPLICLGPEVVFDGDPANPDDITRHENKQKGDSDRPCLTRALELCCGKRSQTLPVIL